MIITKIISLILRLKRAWTYYEYDYSNRMEEVGQRTPYEMMQGYQSDRSSMVPKGKYSTIK